MEDGFDGMLMNATEDDDGTKHDCPGGFDDLSRPRAAIPSHLDLKDPKEPKSQGYRQILGGFQWVENVETNPSRQYRNGRENEKKGIEDLQSIAW